MRKGLYYECVSNKFIKYSSSNAEKQKKAGLNRRWDVITYIKELRKALAESFVWYKYRYISILFPNGKRLSFSHLFAKHTVIISSYTREESEEVFEKKFPLKKELLDIFLDGNWVHNLKVLRKLMKINIPSIQDIKILMILICNFIWFWYLINGDKDFEDIVLISH